MTNSGVNDPMKQLSALKSELLALVKNPSHRANAIRMTDAMVWSICEAIDMLEQRESLDELRRGIAKLQLDGDGCLWLHLDGGEKKASLNLNAVVEGKGPIVRATVILICDRLAKRARPGEGERPFRIDAHPMPFEGDTMQHEDPPRHDDQVIEHSAAIAHLWPCKCVLGRPAPDCPGNPCDGETCNGEGRWHAWRVGVSHCDTCEKARVHG